MSVKQHLDIRNSETKSKTPPNTKIVAARYSIYTNFPSTLGYLISIVVVTQFLDTCNLQYFLQIRGCVSQPYKTVGNITAV